MFARLSQRVIDLPQRRTNCESGGEGRSHMWALPMSRLVDYTAHRGWVGLKIEIHEIHEIHQNLRNPVFITGLQFL